MRKRIQGKVDAFIIVYSEICSEKKEIQFCFSEYTTLF